MNWYLVVLSKYVDFGGRARRMEFWMFSLFNIIFTLLAGILDYALGTNETIEFVYSLAIFLPSLAVLVRRLHDVGKSGWMLLFTLIPIIGQAWLIAMLCSDGDHGWNEWGSNPKEISKSI